MPSTHTSLNFHIVFSTKERLPLITADWKDRLHGYMGGIVKGMEGVPLAIGGIEDHVHLLVSLKTTFRFDYFMRDLKADSSEWVHKEMLKKFEWQKGYGAFTVSSGAVKSVKKYILDQVEHHKGKTFQEEYVEMLKRSEIEYDERYLW